MAYFTCVYERMDISGSDVALLTELVIHLMMITNSSVSRWTVGHERVSNVLLFFGI